MCKDLDWETHWKNTTGKSSTTTTSTTNIWVPTSSFKTSSQTEIISSLPQLVHACTSRSSTRDRAAARRRRERIIGFSSCLLTYRSLSNSMPWSGADGMCIGKLAGKPESCCLVKSIKMHAVCSLSAQLYRNRDRRTRRLQWALPAGALALGAHTLVISSYWTPVLMQLKFKVDALNRVWCVQVSHC